MKSITSTNFLAARFVALFDKLFIRNNSSDKFRILANEKPSEEKTQQSLKISQSHW